MNSWDRPPGKCFGANPVDISPNLVDPSELLIGDVLLFSGTDEASLSAQFLDDCLFDHVALVVDAPPGKESKFPWIADIGAAKQGFRSLDRYALPQGVLVRRHRNRGAGIVANERAHATMPDVVEYDWERILLVILTSLTRFSPLLKRLDNDEKRLGENAARFVMTMHNLMALIGQRNSDLEPKNRKICVTFVADCFDLFDHEPVRLDDQYHGLHVPLRPTGGLLEWVASGRKFLDYLADGVDSSSEVVDFDSNSIVDILWGQFGFKGSQPTFKRGQRLDAQKELELRVSVVQATEAVLRLLGWTPDMAIFTKPKANPSLKSLQAAAVYLLDQLMQQRFVLTVADIMLSKSLVDIGRLDLTKLRQLSPQGYA
jgi:hypothetical protein